MSVAKMSTIRNKTPPQPCPRNGYYQPFSRLEKMPIIGKFSPKTFHYWQQMADSGKAESGRAWQVNKVLAALKRKKFLQKIKCGYRF